VKLSTLKDKIGPLWWYSLIIFCVQRLADVLNAVAGLWLVPKYVPQAELGAVQPLTQVGALLGLPLAVLITPFIKLLNTHAANGEYGKVKALLRDAVIVAAAASVLTIAAARFMMPSVFNFMRVENGRLAMLIVATSIIGAIAPIFTGALQALKRFSVCSYLGLITTPVRFITLLITLPIRGLTGYFAGQSTGPILTIGVAIVDFLRTYGRKVKCESYWRQDKALFIAFLIPIVIGAIFGNIKGTLEMMTLRSLPDIESAAFYHLSRFSEIATYLVSPVIFVLFPIISERHELGKNTHRMLAQTMIFTLGIGSLVALILTVFGKPLFSLGDVTVFGKTIALGGLWKPYIPYTGLFGIMTLMATAKMAFACFTTHEVSCRRFGYLFYCVPLYLIESLLIYGAFHFPEYSKYGQWHLSGVLGLMFVFAVLPLCFAFIDLGINARRRHPESEMA